MKLVYKETGEEVKVGDICCTCGSSQIVEVRHFNPPHKPNSEGKVTVSSIGHDNSQEYYVGIIGATWIDRTDQPDSWQEWHEIGY